MSVTFPRWGGRDETAKLLEQPVRAYLDGPAVHADEAEGDIRAILAELDAIDAAAEAEKRDKARRSELYAEVRARFVVPAAADARCTEVTHTTKWVAGKTEPVIVTHAAKVLVNGHPYCLTHAKLKAERAIAAEVRRLEQERWDRDGLNADEELVQARADELRARRFGA